MLDRTKLIKVISKIGTELFPDGSEVIARALQEWSALTQDPLFVQKVEQARCSFLVPEWRGSLSDVYKIDEDLNEHTVLAVDGSQVYPDRHVSGVNCFLLNTGGVVLRYGKPSRVQLFSEPHIYMPSEIVKGEQSDNFSTDIVDLMREECELALAKAKTEELLEQGTQAEKMVCFLDGTIIFWPLEGKTPEIKTRFLTSYFSLLDYFYHQKVPVAGYISFPKSKELINLIKLNLCRFAIADCIPCHSNYTTFPCKYVDSLIDTVIVRSFLSPGYRTTLFASSSNIVASYPARLRPYFFYLDVGTEIIRIEIPAWVAEDERLVNFVANVALDQSRKGNGYPVCLAEAHEQAVVKGADREFFFHLIFKTGIEHNKRVLMSPKSIKKRGMGV